MATEAVEETRVDPAGAGEMVVEACALEAVETAEMSRKGSATLEEWQ